MIYRFTILLLLSFSIQLPGYAQEEPKELIDLLQKGDKLYSKEKYAEAIEVYQRAAIWLKNDPAINKRIGATLFKLNRYEEATPVLQDLKNSSDSIDIYVEYFLAIAFHKMGRYDEAIRSYENCLKYIDSNSIGDGREDIEMRLAECRLWKKASTNPLDVTITRLDSTFNTSDAEYGFRMAADQSFLFYTSRKRSKLDIGEVLGKPDEDIYWARESKYGNGWTTPEKFSMLNNGMNNAVINLSVDGKTLYMYTDENNGDIVMTRLASENLEMVPLPGMINTAEFSETSFTNREKKIAYFVSNRTDVDHQGGKDIYEATANEKGEWINIRNLGEKINSEADEDFVYWHQEDSSLYFSSNRKNTIGGYDIFVCRTDEKGKLLPPQNIGLPINTIKNDISFVKMGNRAWYASEFEEMQEDIFEVVYNELEIYNEEWSEQVTQLEFQKIDDFETIENIYYSVGQSSVNTRDPAYRNLLKVLQNTAEAKIRLSGHSDWVGENEINDRLSFKRATNLANSLVSQGVDPTMLIIDFHGKRKLLTDTVFINQKLENIARQQNRSVQISIEQQGEPFIYVEQPDNLSLTDEKDDLYSIMVYTSEKPVTMFASDELVKETFCAIGKKYYYHTGRFESPMQALITMNQIQDKYHDIYIFQLQE